MPTEIQWRLKKAERWVPEDDQWKHHGMYPSDDAESLLKIWNGHDPFFEYQIGSGKGPQKEKTGPFGFTFSKRLGKAQVVTKKKPCVVFEPKPHE